MNSLFEVFQNSNIPLLSAFILGIMTAISPCPLATNITATAFLSRNIGNKTHVFYQGLSYTLGRVISYMTLGMIIYFGSNEFEISSFFQKHGEYILGPILILISLLMIDIIPIKFIFLAEAQKRIENSKHASLLNALLLGVIFSLAFCPLSGVFYFGMLIPMTISSANGLYLPIVFAIATALPVIVIAYLLAFTVSSIGNFYKKIKVFELWFRRFVAIIFAAIGIYYTIIIYF
jgi:sulfite exporter TauE/SafE